MFLRVLKSFPRIYFHWSAENGGIYPLSLLLTPGIPQVYDKGQA